VKSRRKVWLNAALCLVAHRSCSDEVAIRKSTSDAARSKVKTSLPDGVDPPAATILSDMVACPTARLTKNDPRYSEDRIPAFPKSALGEEGTREGWRLSAQSHYMGTRLQLRFSNSPTLNDNYIVSGFRMMTTCRASCAHWSLRRAII